MSPFGKINFADFLRAMTDGKKKDPDLTRLINEAFKLFDQEDNGYITIEDFRFVLNGLGERLSEHEVDGMIQFADKDGDGKISFEEFKNVMLLDDEATEADGDGDG